MTVLSVVAPAYNEEQLIGEFVRRCDAVLSQTGATYEIIVVDDGSTDNTFLKLAELRGQFPALKVLRLSRNFGQEPAVHAGLMHATGQAIIVLDSDLQDPPELIPDLLARWRDGADVVVARRRSRGEPPLRRAATAVFHYIFHKFASVSDSPDTGLYCLIDRKVADVLRGMKEFHRYFRGLRAYAGFNRADVWYDRPDRDGAPKQSLAKLFRLAGDALFSFSYAPLRISLLVGFLVSILCISYAVVLFVVRLLNLWVVPGFTTVAVAILFLGGLQLIALGIIGEYIGRIYEEVKERPIFIVSERLGFDPSPPRAEEQSSSDGSRSNGSYRSLPRTAPSQERPS